MKEIWKPIKDFEDSYEVSNLGNVRSVNRFIYCKSKTKPTFFQGKILKQRLDKNGYKIVNLKKEQISHLKKVHRLVAMSFIENKNNLLTINHKDGNKNNNIVSNLEWCTNKENAIHRTKNLLTKPKLNKNAILDIQNNCKPAKNQYDNYNSVSVFAKKYNICRNTVYDILNNKKLYLEAICK